MNGVTTIYVVLVIVFLVSTITTLAFNHQAKITPTERNLKNAQISVFGYILTLIFIIVSLYLS